MSDSDSTPAGPDLGEGVPVDRLVDGEPFFGQVDDAPVYLLKVGTEVRAFSAKCTHYGAPLAKGVVQEGTLRCPWHHACFSVRDGSVLGAPAFNPLAPFRVDIRDGIAFVGQRETRDPLAPVDEGSARSREIAAAEGRSVHSVVIVGAGPAGTTAAETLRREGYRGDVFLVDSDPDAPYDRPNLSKAYLAGKAEESWMPLRSRSFLEEHGIQRIQARVNAIDRNAGTVSLDTGDSLRYDALLLAPGAEPRTLDAPGMGRPHVHTLRSWEDCRRIVAAAESAPRAVVVGASFIGMEVASSLRSRGLDVTVVAPEAVPFARTLGEELGAFIQSLHVNGGVSFRLGRTVTEVRDDEVALDDGTTVPAQLVVVGVGVLPDLSLARDAGLEVDGGIVVDRFLRTSDPAVFAAGDVARFPDPRTGAAVRIEHWVVAGRQGRTAARNILGQNEPFTDAPFFWTRHFGRTLRYVGHATEWDRIERDGDCVEDCAVAFLKDGRRLALATTGRPIESLRAEIALEEPRDRG